MSFGVGGALLHEPVSHGGSERGMVNIIDLIRVVWRKKLWIIAATFIATSLMVFFVVTTKPKYVASAQIYLENQENYFSVPEKSKDIPFQPDLFDINSRAMMGTSRQIVMRAIDALNLRGNPEFDTSGGTGLLTSLGLGTASRASADDKIAEMFSQKLTVFAAINSRVLTVEFSSPNPDFAAKAANTVADLYLELQSQAKRDGAKGASTALSVLLADLRLKSEQAEAGVDEFRSKNGLFAVNGVSNLPNQQMAELSAQLAQARTTEADSSAKAKLIRDMIRQGRIGDIPEVASNELIKNISVQRITLRAQLALEARTLLPAHPRIKELVAQLANIDNDLRAAAEHVVRALENDSRVAGVRVSNLEASLEKLKKVAGVSGKDGVRLKELESNAKLLKDQLESTTARYQEALARENNSSAPADARIFSRATAPIAPTFPKKLPMVMMAAFGSFFLSTGIVLASAILSAPSPMPAQGHPLRHQVLGSTPVEEKKKKPQPTAKSSFLGKLRAAKTEPSAAPQATNTARLANLQVPPSAQPFTAKADDDISILARHIASMGGGAEAVSVMVSSTCALPGSLDTTFALSRALSREKRTLLLDVTNGMARLEGLLAAGGGEFAGLSDLMNNDCTFSEAIHRDPGSRLHIVPAGVAAPLSWEPFYRILAALSQTYECIVLVTPPVGLDEVAEEVAAMAHVGVLIDDETRQVNVEDAYAMLANAGGAQVFVLKSSAHEMAHT